MGQDLLWHKLEQTLGIWYCEQSNNPLNKMKVFVVLNVLLLRGDFFSRFPLDNNSSLTSYRMMPPLLCSLGRGAHEMFKVVLFT